jgi:1-acyl-sn-glycerol-3-phosphate acyltransferase
MVANGAEPVSVQTLRRFTQTFERYGFKAEAMAPAYGLAESTLGLTLPPLGRVPLVDRIDRDALGRRGIAEPARRDDTQALELVSSGRPLSDHEVRVVDDLGRELADRHEGRVVFRGPSATSGYFQNEAKTRELFRNGWLDSGDQGYMADGDVFITGRIKDIIIRAGRHIYPQEIEEAVGNIPGIIKNGVAVFGISDPSSGTEHIVIVAETSDDDTVRRGALAARAREVATDILGAPPEQVVLASPQTVPKTSSGKIRRSAARDLYENGEIGSPKRSPRWQFVRLFVAGTLPRFGRLLRQLGAFLYAAWWWLIVGPTGLIGWLAVMTLPRLEWRWTAVRTIARAALAALGMQPAVRGLGNLPKGHAILAFNHSSYFDALILAAVLPGEPTFAAKRELARQMFAGPFLRRLGAYFVERFDASVGVADAEAVTRAARTGRSIVFFPEGTFSRRAGLTGFYLGAFKVASEAGLSVVPGIILGSRTVLRSDQWFPRLAPIIVYFEPAVPPFGTDFTSVLRLRDQVRHVILARCGEPDLVGLAKPSRGNDLD